MNTTLSKYFFYYPATLLRGEKVLPLLKFARQFQYLPRNVIISYQENRIKAILEHAYNESEYYHNLFIDHGISPKDFQELSDLRKFPTVTKQDIVENSNMIVTRYANSRFVSQKTTGGSTGRAVTITKNSLALAHERAVTWRAYEWAGVTIGDPQARFWGVPLKQLNQIKYNLIDIIANRRRFSAFDVSDLSFSRFHLEMQRFKPKYLYGYSSIILEYSKYLAKNSLTVPPSTKCIITTSEVLTNRMRHLIEKNTGLKVFNEYGCGEVGSIAHECSHGSLHLMDENVVVNIDDSNCEPDSGELVVTDLHNLAFPLINYKIGDYGMLNKRACTCGRTLSVLEKVHGRAYDILITNAGERVHPEYIMYIFEEIKTFTNAVNQFQLIQKGPDNVTLKLVSDKLSKSTYDFIEDRLKSKFGGSLKIDFECVSEIPREPSGKLRLVKRTFH